MSFNNNQRAMPVSVLNGFLGSGKTTLLRNLLIQAAQQQPPIRIAVIVNDMSDLDVDGMIIEGAEVVNKEDGNFFSISGGSIHGVEFLPALLAACETAIQRSNPDHILIETSGSTRPLQLIDALHKHPNLSLRGFYSLVDAATLREDLDFGRSIIPAVSEQLHNGTQGIEKLIAEQILFASDILLSKVDKLQAGEAELIAHAIHPINPLVGIIATQYGNIDLASILEHSAYDFHRVSQVAAEIAEHDQKHPEQTQLISLIIDDPRPFHPQRLWETYLHYLPQALYRSKGTTWFPSRDDQILLWNQAGGGINLEFFNYWKSGVLSHEPSRLSDLEQSQLREIVDAIDPIFGDRRTRITLLGQENETRLFHQKLEQCLCTPQEILAWQAGDSFSDPWPTNTVELSSKNSISPRNN